MKKYALNRRQTMNLNVFHGDVNHRNDVSGRLHSNIKQMTADLVNRRRL